ncbi:MAG: PRC-barrel domain-containing protein [Solirubrobacteraceae bacterium]
MRGATMVDREGARTGKIEDVFLDRHTVGPGWADVKTGWFGHKHTVVPITDAVLGLNGDVLVRSPRTRSRGRRTTSPGRGGAELEREMWEHYGIGGYDEWAAGTDGHTVSDCPVTPKMPWRSSRRP